MSTPIRVLLVEDQEDLRELLADVIQGAGAEVRTAETANAAMALLREGYRCDVLFSDIHMPGTLSGADLASYVQRTLPEATVILASGHPRFQLAPLPAGTLFLQKPFRLNQFMELIQPRA
ncbi:two-component system response regulator [Stenotrophomonas panacihumi]|uniref:Two-component system response regulator n=1 Tax=Stenotrophomonas panacihumi TaxID=676599 RepID=A0A0R0AFB4_9GAMM|nr:response regulator [Stenotrophomonas panacihumi]KRG43718.1 two-component system response regulator [Stenotrophomonas panacihumi]PTN55466.1 response regulator [Stenotrophomonas panacihumi]